MRNGMTGVMETDIIFIPEQKKQQIPPDLLLFLCI